MFDLIVRAVGNTLAIQVVDHLGNIIDDYPLIVDATDPLLTGTVGFTSWGNEYSYYMSYGGETGAPLLIEVPEPATACLVMLAAWGFAEMRRRRHCA